MPQVLVDKDAYETLVSDHLKLREVVVRTGTRAESLASEVQALVDGATNSIATANVLSQEFGADQAILAAIAERNIPTATPYVEETDTVINGGTETVTGTEQVDADTPVTSATAATDISNDGGTDSSAAGETEGSPAVQA